MNIREDPGFFPPANRYLEAQIISRSSATPEQINMSNLAGWRVGSSFERTLPFQVHVGEEFSFTVCARPDRFSFSNLNIMCCHLPCEAGQVAPDWKPLLDEILLDAPSGPIGCYMFQEQGIDVIGHFIYRVKVWEQPNPTPGKLRFVGDGVHLNRLQPRSFLPWQIDMSGC